MNGLQLVIISCNYCGYSFQKDDLVRSCSNCFACTGCETYICPKCENEVVVKPIGTPRKRFKNEN
jgi:predicted Zn-ribbon and HTH transcriptional regulator